MTIFDYTAFFAMAVVFGGLVYAVIWIAISSTLGWMWRSAASMIRELA